MQGVWTTDHVREAENRLLARVPEGSLMRKAAFGLATVALRMLSPGVVGRRVALLVGAGNNGGDALWAGAFLRRRGVAVTAVLLSPDRAHPEGLAALRKAGGRVTTDGHDAVRRADLVIDGIVGLSARGPLRPAAAELVELITAPVLAVDLPSGVEPDTGAVNGAAVTATATVTFGCRKPLHVLGEGAKRSGEVHLVDIGLGPELGEPDITVLEPADVGRLWPVPGPSDDKYTQGVTGVAAGSATYPGAAVLAAGAATLATSGMVRYTGSAADPIRARWPEVVASGSISDTGRVQAWVVGPGMGTGPSGKDVLAQVLEAGVAVCADADAITLLANHKDLWDLREPGTPMVITPHDREFARLAGEVGEDRVAAALRAARRYDVVVLLKGHSTVVAAPDGRVLVNPARSSWAATAGSGDVLSGLIGSLLAGGMDPWLAAGCAAAAHELAGELAADGAPIPAGSLLREVPNAIRVLRAAAVTVSP
ncbi:NAD(P)H-hydrate dehydratase [Allokutzneria sp. A3M-2-11 16]|uniref:NAD(P)H-hydrate dehydratase n=1 Tax=Allokutzneria sp. A3M-2-11 16 TaxID=2962043 RepID=UPI0020B71EF0|nr:NAD(P)H-hydrate dehydratase [Allokutzneria sp. A3M-2-11 16]MCP3798838.1 NAD(P)H-hydrate dehydratase [Allokutzneria sp. A3M-2-11 16]